MTAWKTFRWPLLITAAAVLLGLIFLGTSEAILLLLLVVLEISISFDNAIVNATVLKTMSEKWQKAFLTWGILIAVFGMRLVFPVLIVAAAGAGSVPHVVDMAINDSAAYGHALEEANPIIASFGGMFLLMVFLRFFFDAGKDVHWIKPVEKVLAQTAKIPGLAYAIGALVLAVVVWTAQPENQQDILIAGAVGLLLYLTVTGATALLQKQNAAATTSALARAGLMSFLYLEVLDASFSLDGVIGAFAISKNIITIAVGLGVGAFYIRTLTVYFVRQNTLSKYKFLEHGAHWAIGALAVLLFVGIEYHVPEIITGLIGASLIVGSALHSVRRR